MKLTMKKLFSLAAVLLLALTLVSCGKKEDPKPTPKPDEPVVSDVDKAIVEEALKGVAKDKKVYLTTCGQSDVEKIEAVFRTLGGKVGTYKRGEAVSDKTINVEVSNSLTAAEVKTDATDRPVVLLVTGTSGKGLGAAGTDVPKETGRAADFAAAADANEITLVVLHVGGEARRGQQSDPVLRAACGSANLLLVTVEGNHDGFFDAYKAQNVPTYYFSKTAKMGAAFKTIFGL